MFYPLEVLGGYRARLDDYTVHNLVRFDPGVEHVEHSYYGEHIGHCDQENSLEPSVYTPPSEKNGISRRKISTGWTKRIEVIDDMATYWFGRNSLHNS